MAEKYSRRQGSLLRKTRGAIVLKRFSPLFGPSFCVTYQICFFSLRYSCDHLSESNWTLHTSLTELTNLCEQPGQQPKSTRTQTYKKVRREQTSMDMMENATQRLQTGLGIKMKLTTIMKADVTNTDWIDWKKIVKHGLFLHKIVLYSYLWHYFQVLVNVDEVGMEHRHLETNKI